MQAKTLILIAALGTVGFSGPVAAYDRYDGGPDLGYVDSARVINVKPLYRVVRVPHPERRCWRRQVREVRPAYRSAAPAVLGGIIGGALGHTVGKGDGRTAATVAGVLLGASIGNDMGRGADGATTYVGSERVCRHYVDYTDQQQIDGYQVTYRYHGHRYVTHTDQPPGERIRVRVAVTPLVD